MMDDVEIGWRPVGDEDGVPCDAKVAVGMVRRDPGNRELVIRRVGPWTALDWTTVAEALEP